MTLGTRIAGLRIKHNMSQGDLAEKMNVSRQSVSKWETDASVPDIDNLIFLSNLFDVTLDELVKGETQKSPEADAEVQSTQTYDEPADAMCASVHSLPDNTDVPKSKVTEKPPINPTQRTLGFIFLALGIFAFVVGFTIGLGLLFFAPPLIIYGIVCLTVRKHAALVCNWITIIPCITLMPYFTSTSMQALFSAYYWMELNVYSMQIIIAAVFWVWILVLTFFSAKALPIKRHPFVATGWMTVFLLRGYIGYGLLTPINFQALRYDYVDPLLRLNAIMGLCVGMAANILFILLLVFTIRAIRQQLRQTNHKVKN